MRQGKINGRNKHGSNGPHIKTNGAILQRHEESRSVQTAPEAIEKAEKNHTDRI